MPESRRIVRIFISSPGDVIEERDQARKVIEGLEQQYPGVTLQPVLWEELALPATASFQESIDFLLNQKPIDVAVFILWSRLGTPLGPGITRPDGTPYRSGTEREFDLMLAAFDRSGRKRPVILAYTRDDYAGFQHKLAEAPSTDLELLIAQRRLAEQFIREQFTDVEGHNVRASYSYREPISFAKRLRAHLRQVLDELLETDTGSWPDEPYRALDRFEVEHARIFCGRYEETSELVERLHDQQQAGCAFVAIIGASGSGKSSLARAGVAASLLQHSGDEGVKQWRALFFLPAVEADDLLPRLTRGLAQCVSELGNSEAALASIADGLRRDAPLTVQLSLIPALARAAETAGGPVRLLVVLDQMEELWTDRRITPENREQFFDCIEALARSGSVSVLATLRSDFYAHAQQMPTFLRMKGERGHFDLLPPDTAALRRIIAEPARLAGLTFERHEQTGRTLDELVLQDATRDPGALPLLQYALAELYRQRDREHRQLTFAAYRAMEGVEGALGKRADELFHQLPPESRAALPEILPLLVTVDIGGEQAAVRRRAPKAELITTPQRTELTEKLIDGRFLTTDQQSGVAVIGLAHEALLRRWGQISNWIASNRDHLRIRARVEQSHERWQQQRRHESLLLQPGLPLEEARTLLKAAPHLLLPATAVYIRTSIALDQQHIRQSRRRRRLVTSALSVLALLAIIAAAYALTRQREANARREEAVQAKNRAIKLADDNATLAATEKQSRQRADEQSQLALATLKSVVFDIETKLEDVPAAEAVRQDLLNTAIAGLQKVASALATAPQADLALEVSHSSLGDTFLSVGAGRNTSATELAKQQFEAAQAIAEKMVKSDPKDWQARRAVYVANQRLGEVSEDLGDTSAARDYYQRCLKAAQQWADVAPDDAFSQIGVAQAYRAVGKISREMGNAMAARDDFLQSLNIAQRLAKSRPRSADVQSNLAAAYNSLGAVSVTLGDLAVARNYYEQCLKIQQKLATNSQDAKGQIDLASTYRQLGRLNLQVPDFSAARNDFQLALQIAQKAAAADPNNVSRSYELAQGYEMLGHTNLKLGDGTAARDDFSQELKIANELAAADPHNTNFQLALVVAHEMLGNLRLQSSDSAGARDHYQQSLKIAEQLAAGDPHDAEAQRDLSVIYSKLGGVSTQLGDTAAARAYFEKDLKIVRKLAAADPHNVQARQDLLAAYEYLGEADEQLGDDTVASEMYEQGIKIAQQTVAVAPHDTDAQRELADLHYKLAEISVELGNAAKAQSEFAEYLNLFQGLDAADAHGTNSQRDLATVFDVIGYADLDMDDAAAARPNFEQFVEISRRLAQAQPASVDAQCDLAHGYNDMGFTEKELGNFPAAVKWFQQGEAVLSSLNQSGKLAGQKDHQQWLKISQFQSHLCDSAPRAIVDLPFALKQPSDMVPELLAIRARALARTGKLADAEATAKQLIALNPKDPDNFFRAADVNALCSAAAPPKPPAANSPEKQSRESYAARAVALLKQAEAAGSFKKANNRIALEYDHDLDALRGREDFKKLLNEIMGQSPPTS